MNRIIPLSCLFLLGAALTAADFKPDADGYLRNWLLLEPIEVGEKANEHEESSQKDFLTKEAFAGHFKAKPKAGDKVTISMPGVTAADVSWHAGQADGAVYALEAKDNSLYLATVYVTSEQELSEAVLSIGSDDGSSWRVNGKEVLTVYSGRAAEADQDKSSPFTLIKGTNVISATIINGNGDVGLSARILGKDGSPLKNFTVSLTPPTN